MKTNNTFKTIALLSAFYLTPKPLSEFFRQSPLAGADLDLKRNMDAVRSDIGR